MLETTFSFTKSLELMISTVFNSSQMKLQYKEIDGLPFYVYVSQNMCQLIQQTKGLYTQFLNQFLSKFEPFHAEILKNSVKQLDATLKSSKIKINETHRGWDFSKNTSYIDKKNEKAKNSSPIFQTDRNRNISLGREKLINKHTENDTDSRKFLNELSSEERYIKESPTPNLKKSTKRN